MNKTITVQTAPAYEVRIMPSAKPGDRETLQKECRSLATQIREYCHGSFPRLFVVTDKTVYDLYGEIMDTALWESGFETIPFVIPGGEESKAPAFWSAGLEKLAGEHFTRSDMIIAFGGGVVGDLAGFMAATYLRGIKCIQIPTTLLACVDSSVGGKTAVNLEAGKNLAGAFHQPSLVLINEGFLSSLSEACIRDGLAESIKSGLLGAPALFEEIEIAVEQGPAPGFLASVIAQAVDVKRQLVEADERDTGQRQLLNLGHTIGHALEAASGYSVSHGHAVAYGMYCMAKLVTLGQFGDSTIEAEQMATRLTSLLTRLGYPLTYPYEAVNLAHYLLSDKKRQGETITLVVPASIGHCFLHKVAVDDLSPLLTAALP